MSSGDGAGGWAETARAYTMAGEDAAVLTLRDGRGVYLGARNTNALADQIGERVR
ncbi:hypothetical protein [Demequina aurantiaca]|uniref:hypothetical protein n=1 Tax=Demequina aurantiaca TaxID=676200 RepID=UPI003D348D84